MRTGRGRAGATGSLALLTSLAVVALAACGGDSLARVPISEASTAPALLVGESSLVPSDTTPSNTAPPATEVPLTAPPTTATPATASPTTVALTAPPVSPTDISQPVTALANTPEADESCEAAVARDLGEPWSVSCYQDWASGEPTSYYDGCEDCEALSVLHLDGGRWVEVGTCHAYHTSGCGLRELVPHDALCVIWFNDALLGELWETGCAPRAADLLAAQTAGCADYYDIPFDDVWAESLTCVKGDTVRAAQAVLVRLGYPIEADGYFGPASARSVASFQRSHGLAISAVLDSPTRAALAAA